jgi:glycosyltransferase involved in cell wall biosynthesis
MSQKPTILYFIDSLGYGGAEHLLVNTINATAQEHNNILAYLSAPHSLKEKITGAEVIFLDKAGKAAIPAAAVQLRQLIKKRKVDVVTAHSYWTIILSRLATPRNVGLVNTYHFADYETMQDKINCRRMIRLDKLTYNRRIHTVTVSKYVQGIIEKWCNPQGNIRTIVNFVSEQFSNNRTTTNKGGQWMAGEILKLVAMGSLKKEKNYELLIEAFKELKDLPVQLDIYGDGNSLGPFRELAAANGSTNLVFKGPTSELPVLLPQYHGFVMSSFSEACPLSPIEAMSAGLPLILSDIPPLKEIAAGEALFFRNRDAGSFADTIKSILNGTRPLSLNQQFAAQRLEHYSKRSYLQALSSLYNSAIITRPAV